MNYRQLGKTGLEISELGFGCGAVGGLLVRGDRQEMFRTIARAIDLGINYFDTAAMYGDGRSEENLGRILAELNAGVIVGTKVRLQAEELATIEEAVTASVEKSLSRLRRDSVDLIQLHNLVGAERRPERDQVTVEDVERAMATFQQLERAGKVRFWGFNGLGETDALHEALAGNVQTVQCCHNLLNPSAGVSAPAGFPFQDYAQLIDAAATRDVGVIAIRVLAAGALSGSAERHVNAAQNVAPIASGRDLAEDMALAQRFNFLVAEGYADSLAEAAIRFVIGNSAVSTALVGISSLAQLETAAASVNRGSLPTEAIGRLFDAAAVSEPSNASAGETGTHIAGDVNIHDGDFVARDKMIHGDEVHGDKIVVHLPAQPSSSITQARASAAIAELAAMTFVDLMRILGVRSDPTLFRHNKDRHEEFVSIASSHLLELKEQAERYAFVLNDERYTLAASIVKQYEWMLDKTSAPVTIPASNPGFFHMMCKASIEVVRFCSQADHRRYDADLAIVERVTVRDQATVDSGVSVSPVELWTMRMRLQTAALKEREPDAKLLYGVWFDPSLELAFIYFGIDRFLLQLVG